MRYFRNYADLCIFCANTGADKMQRARARLDRWIVGNVLGSARLTRHN